MAGSNPALPPVVFLPKKEGCRQQGAPSLPLDHKCLNRVWNDIAWSQTPGLWIHIKYDLQLFITLGNVEAHQFGGNQTLGRVANLYTKVYHPLMQKHFCKEPPLTLRFADANFGGAVFDCHACRCILINRTAQQWWLYNCKQGTTAYNTSEAKLDTAITMAKCVLWFCSFMHDIGICFPTMNQFFWVKTLQRLV